MIYEKIVQNNSFFNPMIYSKKKKKKIKWLNSIFASLK